MGEAAAAIKAKIEEGSITMDDLDLMFQAVQEVTEISEDIKDEIEGWDKIVQFDIEDGPSAWMVFKDGEVTAGAGKKDPYDLGYTVSIDVAGGILSGEIDATSAYMSGDLKIDGPIPDAMKFGEILEIFKEEIEEL